MRSKTFLIIFVLIAASISPSSLPDFSLKKIDGTLFNISEVLGKKIIVIDFWATWCKPCRKLLKKLDGVQKEFEKQVTVLAISTDEPSLTIQAALIVILTVPERGHPDIHP